MILLSLHDQNGELILSKDDHIPLEKEHVEWDYEEMIMCLKLSCLHVMHTGYLSIFSLAN